MLEVRRIASSEGVGKNAQDALSEGLPTLG